MAFTIPGPEDVQKVTARATPATAPNAGQEYAALSNLGNSVARLGAVFNQRRQQAEDAGFLANISENAGKTFQEEFESNKPLVDSSEGNFTEKLDQGLSSRSEKLIQTAKTDGGFRPSSSALQRANAQLASMRGGMMSKALAYENNRRVEKLTNQVNQTVDHYAFSAYNSPETIAENLSASDFLIEESTDLFSDTTEKKIQSRHMIAARGFEGWIERDPATALKELRDEKGIASNIEAGTRIRLIKQAETELKRIDARTKADVTIRTQDAVAAYKQGLDYDDPPSKAEFVIAYGQEEGSARFKEFDKTRIMGEAIGALATMPVEEQIQMIGEFKPAPEGVASEGFAAADMRYKTIINSARELDAQKQSDPAAYIMRYSDEYQKVFDSTQSGEFTNDEYAKMMLAEQERLGVLEPKLLPQKQADAIVKQFQSVEEGGENSAQLVQALSSQWGNNWPTVYKQLSKDLPPAALVIASGVDAAVGERLARLSVLKDDDIKAGLDKTETKESSNMMRENLEEFRQTMAYQGGERTFKTIMSQANRLAWSYMNDGMDKDDAVEKAYASIVDDKYHLVGTYRVPKRYDLSDIRDGAAQALDSVDLKDLAIVAPKGVGDDFVKQFTGSAIKRDGYWVTSPDETGLILYYNGTALTKKDGSLIERKFEELILGSTEMRVKRAHRAGMSDAL